MVQIVYTRCHRNVGDVPLFFHIYMETGGMGKYHMSLWMSGLSKRYDDDDDDDV